MINGIKTAAEAKADALVQQQLDAAPNSIGVKVMSILHLLMKFQADNPAALLVNVPAGRYILPTAAIASIQNTWGYVITANSIPKPPEYKGNIQNWSTITKVSWE